MKWDPWMACDDRTPEQKRQDELRHLRHQETALVQQLEAVRTQIKKLAA